MFLKEGVDTPMHTMIMPDMMCLLQGLVTSEGHFITLCEL